MSVSIGSTADPRQSQVSVVKALSSSPLLHAAATTTAGDNDNDDDECPSSPLSIDIATEDEMLRKLVHKAVQLHDVLEEERCNAEKAKREEGLRNNRCRISSLNNLLASATLHSFSKVDYPFGENNNGSAKSSSCSTLSSISSWILFPISTTSISSSSSSNSSNKKGKTSRTTAHNSNNNSNNRQPEAFIFELNVSRLPPAAQYIYTPRNVLAEDQKALPNIPYIDDNTATEDNPFIKEVISSYGDRVHGEKHIKGDQQLVKMVDQLFAVPGSTSCKVFQAIASAFPDEGSKEDVKKRYDRLKSSKATASYCPSIDGPNPIACSRDRSLHSFKTLFCRRCLMYDCLLHGEDMDLSQDLAVRVKIRSRNDFKELNEKLDTKVCSDSCYLLRSNSVINPLDPDFRLNPAAESLIRCEWSSSPGNFCFLAELVSCFGVPCSTIFYWCKREFDDFDLFVGDERKAVVSLNAPSIIRNGPHTITLLNMKLDDDEDDYAENCINDDLNSLASSSSISNGTSGQSINNGKSTKRKKAAKAWTKKKSKYTAWQHKAATAQGKVKYLTPGTVHNYTPCLDHTVCSAETCHCIEKGTFCEKYCLCSNQCPYKFPGCNCNGACNTKQCPCFAASRECDPDLCKPCGSGDLPEVKRCANVDLQKMQKKHLLIAPSDLGSTAGWGCYLKERCEKNDLISEYVGEMISQAEGDRRGLIYDRKKHSFLFCLNSDFSVDATRYGNKIRFANHSVNPNCFAKIMKVNGEHRIGIYAKRDIEEGEELFFDYKYGPNERIEFVPIESSTPGSSASSSSSSRFSNGNSRTK